VREADQRRLSVDVEAQLGAKAFACSVASRPLADPAVLASLREALLARRTVAFDYGSLRRWRKVSAAGGEIDGLTPMSAVKAVRIFSALRFFRTIACQNSKTSL